MRALHAIGLAWLLGCGGAGPEGGDAVEEEPLEQTEGYVLDDPVYRFCHEGGFQRSQAQEWCDLLDGIPEDRCPGFRASCLDPTLEEVTDSRGCGAPVTMLPPGGEPSAPSEPVERPPLPEFRCDAEGCGLDGLTGVQGLLRWVAAFGVAAILLIVFRLLYLTLGRMQPPPRRARLVEAADEEIIEEVPELPSEDLLESARRALGEGRYDEAVVLARGAALRKLHEEGLVRLHRARTDREYARQVRKKHGIHEPFRELLRAVESYRWGGRPVGAPLAQRALQAAERLIGALGVLLLIGALGAQPAAAQGFSRYGPQGDAALEDLFKSRGYEVSWRAEPLEQLVLEPDVLVLDLVGAHPSEEDWEAVKRWVRRGGVLIVAGNAEEHLPELGSYGALPHGLSAALDGRVADHLPNPRWPDGARAVYTGAPHFPWVMVFGDGVVPDPLEPGYRVLFEDEMGAVVLQIPYGEGSVVALADRRMLSNGFLLLPENEAFVGGLLDVGEALGAWSLEEPVLVELMTRAVYSTPDPSGTAANPRLIPFILQLLLTWGLLVLWVGWPFGVLRDSPDEGRVRFSDHADALAAHYQRIGDEAHAAEAMSRLWLRRMGGPGLALAASRAGYDPAGAKRFVQDVEAAAAGGGGGDLTLVEELWRVTRRK